MMKLLAAIKSIKRGNFTKIGRILSIFYFLIFFLFYMIRTCHALYLNKATREGLIYVIIIKKYQNIKKS